MPNRVAAIQMTSTSDVQRNLKQAAELIAYAVKQDAKLVVLPENFALMGKAESDKLNIKETFGSGPIQEFLADQAKKNNLWIVGGTIPIAASDTHKVHNSCLVYDDQGKCIARYDKIHLFDVEISADEKYLESQAIEAGDKAVVIDTPIGRLGLAICYDIRFPELFRILLDKGAEIIALPTAFTVPTGQAHWEVLTRARAIENFCYVIAACQTGTHDNGRQTYGHSEIIEPWGTVIKELNSGMGVITADIDLEKLYQIRKNIPVDKHRKL